MPTRDTADRAFFALTLQSQRTQGFLSELALIDL